MRGTRAKKLRKLVGWLPKEPPTYTTTAWGQIINVGKRQKYLVAKRLYMAGTL